MAQKVITVRAAHDPDADVWFVESSDLPGLHGEAESPEALLEKLPSIIADLIESKEVDEDDGDGDGIDVPIELMARFNTHVRIGRAAA